jgi:hypothetical protein
MVFRFISYNDKHPEHAVRSSSRSKNSPTRLQVGPPTNKPVVPPKPAKPVAVATTEIASSSQSIEKIVRLVGKEKKAKEAVAPAKDLPKTVTKVTKKMFGPDEKAIWKDDFEKAFKALRFKEESQKSR